MTLPLGSATSGASREPRPKCSACASGTASRTDLGPAVVSSRYSKSDAIATLQNLIESGRALTDGKDGPAVDLWQDAVHVALRELFGERSQRLEACEAVAVARRELIAEAEPAELRVDEDAGWLLARVRPVLRLLLLGANAVQEVSNPI